MDTGAGAGGREDSGVNKKGLPRQASGAAISNSGMLERSFEVLNTSRVNALRATIERHSDSISRLLLTCKESADRRAIMSRHFGRVETRLWR